MSLPDEERSTLKPMSKVGLEEGIGDSRVFRDLEYAFCLQHLKPEWSILDVGCSRPWFLLDLMSRGSKVLTIDVDMRVVKERKASGLDAKLMSVTELELACRFDAVVCVSTLEHLLGEDDVKAMAEISRVSSRALITIPFSARPFNWSPRDSFRERTYNYSLFAERILPGWKVSRAARIGVYDDAIKRWIDEKCFYLTRK